MHIEFEWPVPENKGEEATLRHIRESGCFILNVPWGGDDEPCFSYSIGLFANYGHPELIMIGMHRDSASAIINEVRAHVAEGRKFVDGEICDDIIADDYKVCFSQVPLVVYPHYLGRAFWFYEKSPKVFPCLQIVWQDVDRHFPWEPECMPDVKHDQPLLKKTVS